MEQIELLNNIKKYREDVKNSQLLLGADMYIDNLFKNLKIKTTNVETNLYHLNKYYIKLSACYILINDELVLDLMNNYNMNEYDARHLIRKKLFIYFPKVSGLIRFIKLKYCRF